MNTTNTNYLKVLCFDNENHLHDITDFWRKMESNNAILINAKSSRLEFVNLAANGDGSFLESMNLLMQVSPLAILFRCLNLYESGFIIGWARI